MTELKVVTSFIERTVKAAVRLHNSSSAGGAARVHADLRNEIMKKFRLLLTLSMFLLVAPGAARADDPAYALRFDGVSDFVRLASTASMLAPGWQTTKTVSVWVR